MFEYKNGVRVDRADMSIVLQGGLNRANLIETAAHCHHWRTLFPSAEIILSLSGTDVIAQLGEGGLPSRLSLVRSSAADTSLQNALSTIVSVCDKVVMCGDGMPLPPIKSDSSKPNNINLQIAAARNGLSYATRTHVLRVRSDLIFLTDDFIAQYEEMAALPRSASAALRSRVMISWLYTLNPFTFERLPLHFSDWFHFGELSDVKRLWDVPFLELKDAVHYRAHRHAPGSNAAERLFNVRLADEQHLILNALSKIRGDLVLLYHNDQTSVDASLDILVDEFCLCDLTAARAIFDKYSFEFDRYEKRTHCITPEDWRLMVAHRHLGYQSVLSHKIREAFDRKGFELEAGFPRYFEASRLYTKIGVHLNREIVATEPSGVLLFGPHITIRAGQYRAIIEATTLQGPGAIVLRVTLDHGAHVLAERRIGIWSGTTPELEIDFTIEDREASDLEVVMIIEGVRSAAVSGVLIQEREERVLTHSISRSQLFNQQRSRLEIATPDERCDELGRVWRPLGARLPLELGRYAASVNLADIEGTGEVTLQARDTATGRVHGTHSVAVEDGASAYIVLEFDTALSPSTEIQIEYNLKGSASAWIDTLLVVNVADVDDLAHRPTYYPAARLPTRVGQINDGKLVSVGDEGVLSYGPYAALPPGTYQAVLHLEELEGRGVITIEVTGSAGQRRLGMERIKTSFTGKTERRPSVTFSVGESGAFDIEVISRVRGFDRVALAGILIEKLPTP